MSDISIWYVYIVCCSDATLYCGVTTDVSRRLAQHNGECRGGARYTRSRRPVTLLATRRCEGRSEALRLECAVKRLPQAQKLAALQTWIRPGEPQHSPVLGVEADNVRHKQRGR